jgi:Uncharacterized conserved protein (COG2071)
VVIGDELGYRWQTGRGAHRRWNRMAARAAAPMGMPTPGSLEEFIIDHVWAYGPGRDGVTREYRVERPAWRVAPTTGVIWDCDPAATYRHCLLAPYLAAEPTATLIADGSPVRVLPGRRLAIEQRAISAPALSQEARTTAA